MWGKGEVDRDGREEREVCRTWIRYEAGYRRNGNNCFAPSPRRPDREYKRMVLEYTHGLFIT
jgi:hypothetical protein